VTDRKFRLEITLGNVAMFHPVDVVEALKRAAARLHEIALRDPTIAWTFPIHDRNGNKVGSWDWPGSNDPDED
jgi:hypothetical protein